MRTGKDKLTRGFSNRYIPEIRRERQKWRKEKLKIQDI